MESNTESPEADISVVGDHSGPEPYHFKPLAPALVMPEARALGAKAVQSLTGWLHWTRNICGPFVEQFLHHASTIIKESLSGNLTLTLVKKANEV